MALTLPLGRSKYQTFRTPVINLESSLDESDENTEDEDDHNADANGGANENKMVTASICLKMKMRAGRYVRPIRKRLQLTMKKSNRPLSGTRIVPARSAGKIPQRALASVGLPPHRSPVFVLLKFILIV